jgi:hypothetical protein
LVETVVEAAELGCFALAPVSSVYEGAGVDSELVDASEVVLPVPEIDEAMLLEPDMTLLSEEIAEEDWIATREVAIAKIMAVSGLILL